jgi:hypothetical protein
MSFAWQYIRQSPPARQWYILIAVASVSSWHDVRALALALLLVVPAMVVLWLAANYVCWITIGRLLTSAEEREAASPAQRAELAWSFWWRPARGPKP